jgi:predicted ATP-binding protein involved in virulence
MRIDSIQIENFRGIERLDLTFDPRFTLLVGDNASGKTSILSALAVALGIWHVSRIVTGPRQWRDILDHEVREVPNDEGGERHFAAAGPVQITVSGCVGGRPPQTWIRRKRALKSKTVDQDSGPTEADIRTALKKREAKAEALPLLAYYGAGRAWLPSNERSRADLSGDLKARQADGYYDCLNERIRLKDIQRWFILQAAGRDVQGRFKPGFEAVRLALKRGIPGVDEIYWDASRREVVVGINGRVLPFSKLSDGQRTMAATLADMAIRAVALNSHLLGDGNGSSHPAAVLDQTPGVVLIDEVDVHLHPSWQRRVVQDLTEAFPKVQFICSSHSAQVVGEVPAAAAWILGEGPPRHPTVSFADSNWVLAHQMGPEVSERNEEVKQLLDKAERQLGDGELGPAKTTLGTAKERMGGEDGELTRLESSLETLTALARAND